MFIDRLVEKIFNVCNCFHCTLRKITNRPSYTTIKIICKILSKLEYLKTIKFI